LPARQLEARRSARSSRQTRLEAHHPLLQDEASWYCTTCGPVAGLRLRFPQRIDSHAFKCRKSLPSLYSSLRSRCIESCSWSVFSWNSEELHFNHQSGQCRRHRLTRRYGPQVNPRRRLRASDSYVDVFTVRRSILVTSVDCLRSQVIMAGTKTAKRQSS
jgi:hypothetical protein